MNKIIISGRLTKDIDIQTDERGDYGIFTLANDVGFGDNQHTNFIPCVVSGRILKRMQAAKVHKGSAIFISGRLRLTSREMVKNGVSYWQNRVSVSIDEWEFALTGRRQNDSDAKPADLSTAPMPHTTGTPVTPAGVTTATNADANVAVPQSRTPAQSVASAPTSSFGVSTATMGSSAQETSVTAYPGEADDYDGDTFSEFFDENGDARDV